VNYPQAVRLAQSLRGYRRRGGEANPTHTVSLYLSLADEAVWEGLSRLLQLVSGWRSAQLSVAGQPVRYWTFANRLEQVLACYRRKVEHEADEGYCSGQTVPGDEATFFGCRFCRGVSRQVDVWADREEAWIRYGTLSPNHDAFHVDKAAIRTRLEQQTQAEACRLCPAFRWQRVRAAVKDLPDRIPLQGDSRFEVRYSPFNPKKALGIQLKESTQCRAWYMGLQTPERAAETPPVRQVPTVRYTDIAGQAKALAEIRNVVELPLRHTAYFETLRVEPQRGLLLYGPPGNGKTLLAKAVACESHAHLELINGPEILSKWVGQSEENLRRVFARALQFSPSVVLIAMSWTAWHRGESSSVSIMMSSSCRNCSCFWMAWRPVDRSR
jgi:hypothetical protein